MTDCRQVKLFICLKELGQKKQRMLLKCSQEYKNNHFPVTSQLQVSASFVGFFKLVEVYSVELVPECYHRSNRSAVLPRTIPLYSNWEPVKLKQHEGHRLQCRIKSKATSGVGAQIQMGAVHQLILLQLLAFMPVTDRLRERAASTTAGGILKNQTCGSASPQW